MKSNLGVEIFVPSCPSYIKAVVAGQEVSLPVQKLSEEDIRELGKAWTEKLLEMSRRSSLAGSQAA